MLEPGNWPLTALLAVFALAAAVILTAGVRLARRADQLADATGLGEALFGAVLLGGMTSLPGIVTSVVSAFEGYPQLAVSNAIGGIAAQTVFLALADLSYPKANLEHAAASLENLVQATLLMSLLTLPLVGVYTPEVSWLGVHPITLALFVGYALGIRLIAKVREEPLWVPRMTATTRTDEPEHEHPGRSERRALWVEFVLLGLAVAAAGYVVARCGIELVDRGALSESVAGTFFTAVATSLPELVTSIAAVRQGALTLAVGNILGGNSFDLLFLAFSDLAFRGGSIYHAVSERQTFMMALSILLTGILLLGLLRREKSGVGNIGFESAMVLALYLSSVLIVAG